MISFHCTERPDHDSRARTDFGRRRRLCRAPAAKVVVLVGVDVHAEPSREATTAAAHASHSREWVPSCFCSAASRTSGRSEPSTAAAAEGTEQLRKDVVRVGRSEASAAASAAAWHTAEGEGGAAGEAAASASREGVEAAAHSCAVGSSRSEAALEALFAELVIDGTLVLVLRGMCGKRSARGRVEEHGRPLGAKGGDDGR